MTPDTGAPRDAWERVAEPRVADYRGPRVFFPATLECYVGQHDVCDSRRGGRVAEGACQCGHHRKRAALAALAGGQR